MQYKQEYVSMSAGVCSTVSMRLANGVLATESLFIILCLASRSSPNLEHLDGLLGRTNSKYGTSIRSDT